MRVDRSLLDIDDNVAQTDRFPIKDFIISGWRGDGLLTAGSVFVKDFEQKLKQDALEQFYTFSKFNRGQKVDIFQEFIMFAFFLQKDCSFAIDANVFWDHLSDPNSNYHEVLSEFVEYFCARSVSIFIFKIKFLLELAITLNIKITPSQIINSSSTINDLFQDVSNPDLLCYCLQFNYLTWYRPNTNLIRDIDKVFSPLSKIRVSELVHILACDYCKKDYSHSMSHTVFGKFLNTLLLHFSPKESDNINCKFTGDKLNALSLSYWLARRDRLEFDDFLIAPDFIGEDLPTGNSFRIIQEFRYLIHLTKLARFQKVDTISFIAKIIKQKYFGYDGVNISETYNQIVMSVIDLPSNNSHHFLVTKILGQIESLKNDGTLYVLTNQKLFVPSLSERMEQLLEVLKLDAIFDLEGLQGKGEIPSYLLIFKKRGSVKPIFFEEVDVKKEAAITFRFSGKLAYFGQFSILVNTLKDIIDSGKVVNVPIFSKEFSGLTFEFYHDAIIKGKLLGMSQDLGNITHPSFFKKLTDSCVTLEDAFIINSYSGDKSLIDSLLGISRPLKNDPLIMMVDMTDMENVQVSFVSSEFYNAKVQEHGSALFQYFGLVPKLANLNIGIFREYWKTSLGKQIIQLNLSEGSLVRAKVKSLLIPKFFLSNERPSLSLESPLVKALSCQNSDLLEISPMLLEDTYREDDLLKLANSSPWSATSLFCFFKQKVELALKNLELDNSEFAVFRNDYFLKQLLSCPTVSIFPRNADVFIDFENSDYQKAVTKIEISKDDDIDLIKGYCQNELILSIYTDPLLLNFIYYILKSASSSSISQICENLKIPTLSDFTKCMRDFEKRSKVLQDILFRVSKLIDDLIIKQMSAF